jgi:sugar phosphate isomerase/epimerase
MAARQFGISTFLFHRRPLTRQILLDVAARGFETIDLYAARPHFDYHSDAAVDTLRGWLAEAGLTLHAVHAPVSDSPGAGRADAPLSLASPDADARARALFEAEQALYVARRIPTPLLIVHLGLPRTLAAGQGDNSRDGARRSVEALCRLADPLGVQVAAEVIGNELSRPASLVHFLERDLEGSRAGVCLDFGHAHLEGSVADAVEIVSEHLASVELHDNAGRADDHRVPLDGSIDWPTALTTVQKVGYDGPMFLELALRGSITDTLDGGVRARRRLERFLAV